MKKLVFIPALLFLFLFYACPIYTDVPGDPYDYEDPGNETTNSTVLQLMGYYLPNGTQAVGSDPGIVLLSSENQGNYKIWGNIYPPVSLEENASIRNLHMFMGLHANFNDTEIFHLITRGTSFNMVEGNLTYLPLIQPDNTESYFPYIETNTGKLSTNGYAFYLSSTNNKLYGDTYDQNLLRYNISSSEFEIAISPTSFTLMQPEKSWDTEVGQFLGHFLPSNDGRYVYGVIQAWGVEAGANHYDYLVLFEYDFSTGNYSRIGTSSNVELLGITSDGLHLLYRDNTIGKLVVYNTASKSLKQLSMDRYAFRKNQSCWNSKGYCTETLVTNYTSKIDFYNIVDDEIIAVAEVNDRSFSTQFSADGDYIVFSINGNTEKKVCATNGLYAGAGYKELFTIPNEIVDFLVVK